MNNIQITILLLGFLLLTVSNHGVYLQATFKIVRKVGGNVTCEDVKRSVDLEYPRRNKNILYKVRELWEEYYRCLQLAARAEIKPEIRRLQQGQYTELPCEICARPFQDYEELEWKYEKLFPRDLHCEKEALQNLSLTPEMVITPNKTLKIYNVAESFGGLYVCYRGYNVISVYILEVSHNDTVEKDVMETRGDNLVRTHENGLRISYAWSEWTECNSCGRVGKKFKYGACYVSLQDSDFCGKAVEKRSRQKSIADFNGFLNGRLMDEQSLRRKFLNHLKARSPVSKASKTGGFGFQMLEKFATGIPCASQLLPREIFDIIGNVTAVKVLVKHCWEPCEKSEIFVVLDNRGKIIEKANNTAGIYSIFQGFPQIPRDVVRRTLLADFGKSVIIHCPGTSLTNTPAVWKIKNKILFPDVVANDSKGRVTIDLINRIHIRKLRLRDSYTYSCWHKTQLVGTVRLIIEKKCSISFNHHVILFLILVTAVTIILAGRKVIANVTCRIYK